MGESLTVSGRLPVDYKHKLEGILDGKSLGLWLQEVIDGHESVDDLEARAKELERTVKDREEKVRELEEKLERHRSSLDQLQALRKAGVSPEELARWSKTLSHVGADAGKLAADIELYSSLLGTCRELEGRERKLEASVRALEAKRGELEGAVASLRDSALATIAELRDRALAEVEAAGTKMREKIEAYGEACRLSQVLARDLSMAAALYSMADPETAAKVKPESVLLVLDRIRRWAQATGMNIKAKPPDAVTGGNWLYAGWELGLEELILWAAVSLLPLCEDSGVKQGV